MQVILVAGSGNIGTAIASLLASTGDFEVHLVDIHLQGDRQNDPQAPIQYAVLDMQNQPAVVHYIKTHQITVVISCLPYFCNSLLAKIAKTCHLHYFDLTEDVSLSEEIKALAQDASTGFMPHCGLAPGFIGIVASDLMARFDKIDSVLMRVGALPQNSQNALQYALTWSVEGLINEYGNTCYGIERGQMTALQPLEGLERLIVEGKLFEAFHTSGGLGTLAQTYAEKVQTMNYKTLRYPGHCEKMRFLMNDLKLNENRALLKNILEAALPKTCQDTVLMYVAVSGQQNGYFVEETYVKKMSPQKIGSLSLTAIQLSTAASACAVVDLMLQAPDVPTGFIKQESIPLAAFLGNRFGRYYQEENNQEDKNGFFKKTGHRTNQ